MSYLQKMKLRYICFSGFHVLLLTILSMCAVQSTIAQTAVPKNKVGRRPPTILTGSIISEDYCGVSYGMVCLCDSQNRPLGRVTKTDSNGNFSIDIGPFNSALKRNLHLIVSATGLDTFRAAIRDYTLDKGITIMIFEKWGETISCGWKWTTIEIEERLSPPPLRLYAHYMAIKHPSRREELRTWRRRFFRWD